MRLLGRMLLLALAGAIIASLVAVVRPLLEAGPGGGNQFDQATTSTFFPLARDHWLSFDIPRESDLYRFYAHAALSPELGQLLVSYTLEFQWLDSDGELLAEKQYHITTRVSPQVRIPGDASLEDGPTDLRFYDHERARPSRDNALYFSAAAQPGARLLRLRIVEAEEGVRQVGIRAYQQHRRPARDIDVAWQRMSKSQREDLSKSSVYPDFLLSEYERSNLLSHYWRPVGPLGVLDEDFTIDKLYQRDIPAPGIPPETPATSGLFASPQQWVTIPLELPVGRYRIEWLPSPKLAVPQQLQLLWQSADLQQQQSWQTAVGEHNWEGDLEGGLLQVVPDRPGAMKLLRLQDGEWLDTTPERRYLRAYVCSPEAPLRFQLAPGEQMQSLKLDLRGFYRQDEGPAVEEPRATLRLTSDAGQVTYESTLDLPTQNYPYQHFPDAVAIPGYIFEPLSSYLDASGDSAELELQCSAPVLASAYTRPWRHPLRRSLPEPQHHWLSYDEREPAWFSLQPDQADELVRSKRYHSLLWFFRPTGMGGLTADGDYTLHALENSSLETVEWQVFTRRDSDSQLRMEALTSAYRPLQAAQTVELAGSSNEAQVRPSLIFLRDDSEPATVQVWIDDRLALETRIAGTSGRLRLPAISAGSHRIEVRPQAMDWYLNHVAGAGQTHLLRSAFSLRKIGEREGRLNFDLETTGSEQQLSLWLYAPQEATALECGLTVQAQRNPAVQLQHSVRDFHYRVDSQAFAPAHVLRRRNSGLRGPIRLLVPLRDDLPPQTTTARLNCNHPGVLASASIISKGRQAYRYFEDSYVLF